MIDEMTKQLGLYRRLKKNITAVLDVPLLFEAGLDRYVDVTVVVQSTLQQQEDRAVKALGISRAEVRKRIKAQWPLKKKIRKADLIINNKGNLKQTKKQVEEIWLNLSQKTKNTK